MNPRAQAEERYELGTKMIRSKMVKRDSHTHKEEDAHSQQSTEEENSTVPPREHGHWGECAIPTIKHS